MGDGVGGAHMVDRACEQSIAPHVNFSDTYSSAATDKPLGSLEKLVQSIDARNASIPPPPCISCFHLQDVDRDIAGGAGQGQLSRGICESAAEKSCCSTLRCVCKYSGKPWSRMRTCTCRAWCFATCEWSWRALLLPHSTRAAEVLPTSPESIRGPPQAGLGGCSGRRPRGIGC